MNMSGIILIALFELAFPELNIPWYLWFLAIVTMLE